MKKLIRYTVKPDRAEENAELVRAVYEELDRLQPDGVRYATFRLDDGVSFVHLVSVETADGASPLPGLPAFQQFQHGIADRCAEQPTVADLHEVGSYRLFGA
jgi:hypothetical protein